ncbi:MAG: hypothetical protein RQ899_08475 [Pseudomonadales bacterium]|nr:hypothetical protein [Pseudomonadales bacterium]
MMLAIMSWMPAHGFAAEPTDSGTPSYVPGIELPAGEGRALLLAACTRCHDLRGLSAYKGYWNREQWQSMVATMVKNGALLDTRQMALVSEYLTSHFGRDRP